MQDYKVRKPIIQQAYGQMFDSSCANAQGQLVPLEPLGEGAFGSVSSAEYRGPDSDERGLKHGQVVAVKILLVCLYPL